MLPTNLKLKEHYDLFIDGKWVNLDDEYPVEYGWEDANDYCIIRYKNPRTADSLEGL